MAKESSSAEQPDPARERRNLTIVTDALTEKLLLEGTRCVGVRYRTGGRSKEVRATREVIVSAGAINSPQLLELSGIGQPDLLQALGIKLHHDLPRVGENLRDHYAPRMKWGVTKPGLTYNDKARGLGLVWQALRYAVAKEGLLSLPASPLRAYVRSREGLEFADLGISVIPFLVAAGVKLDKQSGLTMVVHVLRSDSTGSIHVTSPDPKKPPAINFNFLSDEDDRTKFLAGMRIVRNWINAPAMAEIRGPEIAPGEALQGAAELLEWVKCNAETAYHPVGTCKMGSDPMAVVNDQLKVHGLQGLRVADASIMPTLTSGNTNAPSIMIGEKAATMVLRDTDVSTGKAA